MNPEVRARLQKKFGKINTRTGGKGTVRRKKKNSKSKIISSRINQQEKKFISLVDAVNNSIKSLENEELELWNIFFEDWLQDIIMDFRKKDFKKKSPFDIIYVRENYEDFIEIFIESPSKYTLFKNPYSFCNEQLTDKGYDYYFNSLEGIPKIIKNKDYYPEEAEFKVENVNKLLEILGLPIDKIPDRKTLKKAYFKLSAKNHPDKHPDELEKYNEIFGNINKAYHDLLRYYFNEKKNSQLELN